MTRTLLRHSALWLIFLGIAACAFLVRVYRVDRVPAGFFADEASIGYNAWTLLTTGRDEYGVPYPFFFRSFGDYRNPFPVYANMPAVWLFGLNEFSVRLTAVAAGTLTVILVFFVCLAAQRGKNGSSGLIFAFSAMFFLAFSPWHIHFSRFGSEYIYFPFLLMLGFLVFLLARTKPPLYPLSGLLFGATLYTYYPTWLVTPLFVTALTVFYRRDLFRQKAYGLSFLIVFLLSFIPLFLGISRGIALTRWKNVAITKENNTPLPVFFLKNYVNHFSPEFLFTKGDIDYPGHFIRRFSSRGAAELYIAQLPFLILGLWVILRSRSPFHLAVLMLLLLYPLGSSLTATDGGAPLAFRSVIGVLPFQFITALGITYVWDHIRPVSGKVFFGFLLILTSLLFSKEYIKEYHSEYIKYSSDFWGWQFGPRDVMAYFLRHNTDYLEFYLLGDFNSPEIFLKFYDPTNRCRDRCRVGGFEMLDPQKKQLFAVSASRLEEQPQENKFDIKQIIYYPNGDPAFFLMTRSAEPVSASGQV